MPWVVFGIVTVVFLYLEKHHHDNTNTVVVVVFLYLEKHRHDTKKQLT